jgi:hypothetical protein
MGVMGPSDPPEIKKQLLNENEIKNAPYSFL